MCGRFTQTKIAAVLAQEFQLEEIPEWQPRYNIAPTQSVPTIIAGAIATPRSLKLMRWGLIPSWAKDVTIGSKLINARAETVHEKPAFRSAYKQRRCLILSDGFYEWQRLNGKKQPYYFQLRDGQSFAFAGLWEHWQGDDGTIETCTIITTEANEQLRPIHDRMPVMLAAPHYDLWLAPNTPLERLQALLQPFDDNAMQGYPVSPLVNSPANDTAACVTPLQSLP